MCPVANQKPNGSIRRQLPFTFRMKQAQKVEECESRNESRVARAIPSRHLPPRLAVTEVRSSRTRTRRRIRFRHCYFHSIVSRFESAAALIELSSNRLTRLRLHLHFSRIREQIQRFARTGLPRIFSRTLVTSDAELGPELGIIHHSDD